MLPQLSLTLTNAVIVTASLSRELFPATGSIASERNLALSSGLANVLLCPFGAMPMCHGAGGLAAQYRFGARTGLAPIIFGVVMLILAVGFADHAAALFAIIPIGAVGALLILAGTDLAISRRLFDGRPSCWPVIGVTALATLTINPALDWSLGGSPSLSARRSCAGLFRKRRNHKRWGGRPPTASMCQGRGVMTATGGAFYGEGYHHWGRLGQACVSVPRRLRRWDGGFRKKLSGRSFCLFCRRSRGVWWRWRPVPGAHCWARDIELRAMRFA